MAATAAVGAQYPALQPLRGGEELRRARAALAGPVLEKPFTALQVWQACQRWHWCWSSSRSCSRGCCSGAQASMRCCGQEPGSPPSASSAVPDEAEYSLPVPVPNTAEPAVRELAALARRYGQADTQDFEVVCAARPRAGAGVGAGTTATRGQHVRPAQVQPWPGSAGAGHQAGHHTRQPARLALPGGGGGASAVRQSQHCRALCLQATERYEAATKLRPTSHAALYK